MGLFGYLSSYLIDRGKISLAAIFRRRAHANKNGVARADRFAGIRGIGNAPRLACRPQYFFQVLLIDRYLSGLQTLDTFCVDVRAGHFMPRRGETRPRHQSHVATSNYRETQVWFSLEALQLVTQKRP